MRRLKPRIELVNFGELNNETYEVNFDRPLVFEPNNLYLLEISSRDSIHPMDESRHIPNNLLQLVFKSPSKEDFNPEKDYGELTIWLSTKDSPNGTLGEYRNGDIFIDMAVKYKNGLVVSDVASVTYNDVLYLNTIVKIYKIN